MAAGEEEGERAGERLLLAAAPAWALRERPDSNWNVLSSLLDTRRGEIKGQGGWIPRLRELSLRKKGTAPGARRGLPQKPELARRTRGSTTSRAPPALPSQLRLHLEEIAQRIPVGTFDPVIRDEAPGSWGHTGGDRRAGRGGARGHRDFEHLRGGTPEAATTVAAAAGARSPAARRRLRTQEQEVASFTHTHTPTAAAAAASPGALGRAQAAAFLLHAREGGREGGWVEKGARNRERVWRENPVAVSRRGEAEALQRREIPSPFSPSLPTSPPPSAEPFQPPPFFPFSLPGCGCGGAGKGGSGCGSLGKARGPEHHPTRPPAGAGSLERTARGGTLAPGVAGAQRSLGAQGSGPPSRRVRKRPDCCWRHSSLPERVQVASPSHLAPANQPSLVRPSVKAYTGGWGGCPVVADFPRLLCPAPGKAGG